MITTTHDIVLWSDHHFTSPWVLAVWAALHEKQIPFTVATVDLAHGEHRTADYRAHSITAKVPAIRHDDFWLAESSAILEYLEEVFAPPAHRQLLPVDMCERARDRHLMSWIRTDLFELRRSMPFEGIFQTLATPPLSEAAREDAGKLVEVAAGRATPNRAENPTLADFDLAFMIRRLDHYGHGLSGAEDVARYADKIWARPSVQSWVKQARPEDPTT